MNATAAGNDSGTANVLADAEFINEVK